MDAGKRDLAVERVISLAFGVLCCSQVNTCSARAPNTSSDGD